MTTSGVTVWNLTARDIVKQAMIEIGVLSTGEEPEASEMQDSLVRLNAMLKTWATAGGLGHLETTGTVTIPANASSGVLASGIRNINSARVVTSATNHRQMVPFNRSQYQMLPNKTATGSPTAYYLQDSGDSTTMYVWPVPTAITTISIDYGRVIETVTDASQTLDIPQEWQEAAYLGLAARIAGMFGATRLDARMVSEVKERAERAYARLLDNDRPDSYYFEPFERYY